MSSFWFRMASLIAVVPVVPVAAGTGPASGKVVAISRIEPGQWELRDRAADRTAQPTRLCVSDPAQLLKVRHQRQSCRDFVVDDAQDRAVVTYDCNGAGSGRTAIRVETPRLVQIDSQGIAGGAPFAMLLEGRRTGECH